MIKSKKIKVLIISILCILTITIGLSYGYYLLNKVQENNNIAGSKCFNLEFTNEKNAISLDNTYPISDEEGRKLTPYSFTITNTCDMLAGYTVNMEMLEGTTLSSKYLDVMVNNEEIKLLTNYESTNTVITGSTESRILAKGTLAYNDSVDYTVRFWMDKDVEDTESMNKLFKSKIVISATPSSWNPKDAGYDTLHDAILANEYQTTPEMAKEKIAAKQEVDLSQTAPIIKWVEKTGESITRQVIKPAESAIKSDAQTSDLTSNDTKLKLYTKINFDNDAGKYTLSEAIYLDPTEIDYDSGVKYYFLNEYIRTDSNTSKLQSLSENISIEVYEVGRATKDNTQSSWNDVSYDSITYKLQLKTLVAEELETDKSDKGLYQDIDDYGITYYYRGNVVNNNVYFAGFFWKIMRINGDGSIRLLYDGIARDSTGNQKSIQPSRYNDNYTNPIYVGYMYGNDSANNYNDGNKNENNSLIKQNIDGWYEDNILSQNFNNIIADSGFCNDRGLYTGDGYTVQTSTEFNGYIRERNNNAIFTCQNKNNDLFTTNKSKIGNNALTYPIGLPTYDEMKYAGLGKSLNRYSYVSSSYSFFTMTPSYYSEYWRTSSMIEAGVAFSTGGAVNYNKGVRPVINLKSNVKISGGIGTSNDPYVIDTSK